MQRRVLSYPLLRMGCIPKMHERINRRSSLIENILIWGLAFLCLGLAIKMDRVGMPQKWHAAIVGTAVSFGGVVLVYRTKWSQWHFWAAIAVCFVVHLLVISIVFDKVLASVEVLGILLWSPIAFAEGIFLLGIVPMVQRKFTSRERRGSKADSFHSH